MRSTGPADSYEPAPPPDQHVLRLLGVYSDAGARSHSGGRAHYLRWHVDAARTLDAWIGSARPDVLNRAREKSSRGRGGVSAGRGRAGGRLRPPLRVGPSLQPGLLGPGQEQATGRRRNAGLGRWRVAQSVQRGDDGCGPLAGLGNAVGPSSGGRQLGPVGLQPQRRRIAQARQLRGDALGVLFGDPAQALGDRGGRLIVAALPQRQLGPPTQTDQCSAGGASCSAWSNSLPGSYPLGRPQTTHSWLRTTPKVGLCW
jgi:hypothetical protein